MHRSDKPLVVSSRVSPALPTSLVSLFIYFLSRSLIRPIKNAKNNEPKNHQLLVKSLSKSLSKSKLGQLLLANRSIIKKINRIKNHAVVVRQHEFNSFRSFRVSYEACRIIARELALVVKRSKA